MPTVNSCPALGIANALPRCVPFGLFIALLGLSSLVEEPWLIAVRSILVAAVLLWYWPRYTELRNAAPARAVDWALAGAAGMAVFVAWTLLDHRLIGGGRSSGFTPLLADGGMDWLLALVRLAGFALVVPVMEELFWRSFLLRWIDQQDFLSYAPSQISLRAVLISSALFSLEHNQWVAGALASLVYSALYIRSGNLWVPVAAHAVTNLALGVWIISTGNWQFW